MTSFTHKFNKVRNVEVKPIPLSADGYGGRHVGDIMVISTPQEISSIISKVPKGKLITTSQIRDILTKNHKADFTCQITTGIFLNIIAGYVEENKLTTIPYWRVTKDDGSLNTKFPSGGDIQKAHLESEGISIIKTKNKFIVESLEKYLIKI